jgi:hypothetical protein
MIKTRPKQKQYREQHFVDVQQSARLIVQEMWNNKTHAAKLLGVSWLTLHRWMRGQPARPVYAAVVTRTLFELKKRSKAG